MDNTNRVINESATIADWSRMPNPTSPHLFIEGNSLDLDIITKELTNNSYAMFLRKVGKTFPDSILLDFIYNKDFNPLKKENNNKYSMISLYNLYRVAYICGIVYLFYCVSFVIKKTI